MLRVRMPDCVRLSLSDGEWILVKKHLTAGEYRRVMARQIRSWSPEGKAELNPLEVGRSQMIEYLLDWSASGPDGKPIVIRDKSPDEVGAALDMLPPEAFEEIREAVGKHVEAMDAERAAEKNDRTGEKSASAISPSPSVVAGASIGSVN